MEEKSMFAVLAIVALFAAAGVFFTLSNDGPSVVYVQSGASQAVAPAPVRASMPARILTAPFKVFGRSITGAAHVQIGNATTNFTEVIDLFMNKSIVNCNATLTSGVLSAYLNTCNDGGGTGGTATSGGTIVCDGGTNASASPTVCHGGFILTNQGVEGELTSFLNASSGPFDNILTYTVNIDGCNSSCSAHPNTNPLTLSGAEQTVCNNMTSGGALCQCMAIQITSTANMNSAKSGHPVTFRKQDTLSTPANPC